MFEGNSPAELPTKQDRQVPAGMPTKDAELLAS